MRLAFVANEPVIPAIHGGRKRMLGVVGALSTEMEVHLIEPSIGPSSDDPIVGVRRHPVAHQRVERSLRHFASRSPRLGWACFDGRSLPRLAGVLDQVRPDVVMVSHSYLAPALHGVVPAGARLVVDFPNLETERLMSLSRTGTGLHRLTALLEAKKAERWEPRSARRGVCVAVDEQDEGALLRWGATQTCVVPNAIDERFPYRPSPRSGPALLLASAGYGPNTAGGRWLCDAVWPTVRRLAPEAELWIAGWGTESVYASDPTRQIRVIGAVDDLTSLIEDASVCVAPVRSGAGTQLKVLDMLARHRVVVATRYSARSIPASARPASVVTDDPTSFARGIAAALREPEERWSRERFVSGHVPLWREAIRPLVDVLNAA